MDIKKITFNETFVDNLIEAEEITENDLIIFTEDVYETGLFTATIIGKRTVLSKITKQSFGNNYITFSMEVIECTGTKSEELLKKIFIRRREKTIFSKYNVYRQLWDNELNRCYFLDDQFAFKNSII